MQEDQGHIPLGKDYGCHRKRAAAATVGPSARGARRHQGIGEFLGAIGESFKSRKISAQPLQGAALYFDPAQSARWRTSICWSQHAGRTPGLSDPAGSTADSGDAAASRRAVIVFEAVTSAHFEVPPPTSDWSDFAWLIAHALAPMHAPRPRSSGALLPLSACPVQRPQATLAVHRRLRRIATSAQSNEDCGNALPEGRPPRWTGHGIRLTFS